MMEAPHQSSWPWKTFLFVGAVLLSELWWSIFRDGWGFLLSGVFSLALLGWLLGCAFSLLLNRSRRAIYRLLTIIAGVVLILPVLWMGGLIRNQIFLANLAYYQAAVDRISASTNEASAAHRINGVAAPGNFSSSLVGDSISVERDVADSALTVLFLTRDSSALGHSGFLYRSDDNAEAVKKERPEIGLRQLAPKWYVWGT